MTITHVQSRGADSDNSTTAVLAFSGNVTDGNRIVICVAVYTDTNDPPALADISQSAGTCTLGAFSLDKVNTRNITGDDFIHTAIYSAEVTGTGSCTITVAAVDPSYWNIGLVEINSDAGVPAIGSTNGTNGSSTTPDTGNATSSLGVGAIFIGGLSVAVASVLTITPDGAFTQIYEQQDGTAHNVGSFIYRIVASSTTDSASWTLGSSREWVASLVVYEDPGGSSSSSSSSTSSSSTSSSSTSSSSTSSSSSSTSSSSSSSSTSSSSSSTSSMPPIPSSPKRGISPVAYELWLTTDRGQRLAQLDYTLGLSATVADKKPGWFSLSVPPSFNLNLIKSDNLVQIWRAPKGGRLKLWRVYLLRKWTFSTDDSREVILLEGPDMKDLLRRRIVAAYAGSAQASKTDYADDMMKEVVTQSIANGVAPVPTAGTRVWSNLSVAGDTSSGPAISKDFPFDFLMTSSGNGVIPALAKAAREAGTEVFFDIVPNVVSTDSITFQFQTKTGQPGLDVSDRVVFSQDRGNLRDPSLTFDYSEEENYIYAGGQGEEENRNIQQVYDSDRYVASIWNRCEGFADARNQTTDNGVREAGRARLEEGRPKISFSASLLDTEATRFGLDWDYGYTVKTKYKNIEFSSIVRAVTILVDSNGEQIQAKADYNE